MKINTNLKSFICHLKRNKMNTAINVFGFAISLMFVILISLYIQTETSVDKFHRNSDLIYRLEHADGMLFSPATTAALQNSFPEIESTLRIEIGGEGWVHSPITGELYAKSYWNTDSTVFDFFDFEFVEGDPKTALQDSESIVISENLAKIMFNDAPALGQRVKESKTSNDYMIVTGVVKYLDDSHFNRVDVIKPWSSQKKIWTGMMGIDINAVQGPKAYTYIMAKEGMSLEGEEEDVLKCVLDIGDKKFTEVPKQSITITPLRSAYFNNEKDTRNDFRSNEHTFIAILSITALMILLFAIINYINLSVAQSGFRAKEVATRQIFGEQKMRVVSRFIMESIAMCAGSAVIGIILAYLAQGYFNSIMHSDISLLQSTTISNISLLCVAVVLIGVVSGAAPAAVIVGYNAIDVVRGTLKRKINMTFSKILITFQYTIAIILIGCTITITRQLTYMQTSELGYKTDFIIGMSNPTGWSGQDKVRNDLMQIPGVQQVSLTRAYPTPNGYNTNVNAKWKTIDGTEVEIQRFVGDTSFFSVMGFEVLHSTGIEDKSAEWLNETAWKKLGLTPDATEVKINDSTVVKLKGIIRDFHYQDYSKPITAVSIADLNDRGYFILVKVSQSLPYETMESVKKVINDVRGVDLFDGVFLDEQIAAQYAKQRRMTQIIGALSFVAIVIAALGMLAMAVYFIRQRRNEAGIRKVFGSSTPQLLVKFLLGFMRNVVIAYILAVPITYQLMQIWLSDYAYKIGLSWTIFALAGLIVFCVAAVVVFYQSYKIALTNPVTTLK